MKLTLVPVNFTIGSHIRSVECLFINTLNMILQTNQSGKYDQKKTAMRHKNDILVVFTIIEANAANKKLF